jgi:hypothetical protein
MLYMGIDPGLSGGLACVDQYMTLLWVQAMPPTPWELLVFLRRVNEDRAVRAMVEHAHSFPKQGHTGAFTFGKNIGHLEMALLAAGIPANTVSPKAWQLELQCLTGGNKNISKRRAQELFPSATSITHATADALLLAEYGRRLWLGTLRRPDGKVQDEDHQHAPATPDQGPGEQAPGDREGQAAHPPTSATARRIPGAARTAAARHERARSRP